MNNKSNTINIKEGLYCILAEAAEDIIFILNKEGTILYINNYGAAFLNSQPSSLINKNLSEILPSYFNEIQKRNLQIIFRLKKTVSFIDKIEFSEKQIWLDTKLVPIKYDNKILLIMGIARDITNKKKSEVELQKAKLYLQKILENSTDLIFTLKKNGFPGFVNPKVYNFTGYTEEEASKKFFLDYLPFDQKKFILENFEKAFSGIPVKLETDVIKADGSIMHCYVSASLLEGYDELLISVLDITNRKKMENELRQTTAELKAIFNALPDVYFRLNNDGTIIDWMASDPSELYIPPSEFMNKKMQDLLPENIKKYSAYAIYQVAKHRKPIAIEYSLPMAKGEQFYEARILPLLDDQLIIVSRNITERKKIEEELKIANLIIENSPVILFIKKADENAPVEYVTKNISQFGYTIDDFYSGRIRYNDIIFFDDKERVIREIKQHIKEGRNEFHLIYRILNASQEIKWIDDWSFVEKDNAGNVTYFQSIIRDITERKWAEERLNYLAYHDALTGLPNRLLFNDRLSQAITRAEIHKELVGIMLLDLDNFKDVNDNLGHDIGDLLLQATAERLKSCLKPGDTVGRLSGDEFTFIIQDIITVQEIENAAQKIMNAFLQPFVIDYHTLHITSSMGITAYPIDGAKIDTLLKNADIAMYRAKNMGKNNYQFFEHSMNIAVTEKIALQKNLYKAIKNKELVIYYQPYIDLRSKKIVAIEALIRWHHPEIGLLLPEKFINFAEETGLIIPIDEWVLRMAIYQNKQWQIAGFKPVRIAVNLSAREFHRKELINTIQDCLNETLLNPEFLELEITETTTMLNIDYTITLLHKLSNMGIKITIDDFGTGYSSLIYLKKFPIHALKINEHFIKDININEQNAAMVASIINLAHNMNLKVIAESVETEEQMKKLEELGCDEMQGFLFSKPLPPHQIPSLIK